MSVSANGIDGKGPMIEGNPSTGRTVDVIPSWGVNTLTRQSLTSQSNDIEGILDIMSYINEETDISSGIFANYWAQNLIDTLNRTDYLSELLGSTTLINDSLFTGSIGKKLDIVSRMILKHDEREVNRDAFYMTMGGFDGHSLSNEGLEGNLNVIEQGLRAFYKELTDQNMLDNVTVVVLSEFGRTISPNSGLGSDHACKLFVSVNFLVIHLSQTQLCYPDNIPQGAEMLLFLVEKLTVASYLASTLNDWMIRTFST